MKALKLNVWVKKDQSTIILNNHPETEKKARSLGWKIDKTRNQQAAQSRNAQNVDS